MKVLVFRDEHAAVLARQLPNGRVTRAALAEETNVQGIWEEIAQCRHQRFRQLFVEEQAHDSGGRNSQCAALPLSRVRQARPDVFPGELREIRQDLFFRHPASQVPKDVTNGDASPPHAGLAEADIRGDRDALQRAHAPSLRQPPRRQQKAVRVRIFRFHRPNPVYNALMTSRAQGLLREALSLPIDERASVAAELLASLDDDAVESPVEVEAAWAEEIEKRARRVMAGESQGIAWEDVRARAEAALRKL